MQGYSKQLWHTQTKEKFMLWNEWLLGDNSLLGCMQCTSIGSTEVSQQISGIYCHHFEGQRESQASNERESSINTTWQTTILLHYLPFACSSKKLFSRTTSICSFPFFFCLWLRPILKPLHRYLVSNYNSYKYFILIIIRHGKWMSIFQSSMAFTSIEINKYNVIALRCMYYWACQHLLLSANWGEQIWMVKYS